MRSGFVDEAVRIYAGSMTDGTGDVTALIDTARDACVRQHYHRAVFFLRAAEAVLCNLGLVEQSGPRDNIDRDEQARELERANRTIATLTTLFEEVAATSKADV